jgi:UDP-N-acetyl-D-mannosaminuronate dehydrogenase
VCIPYSEKFETIVKGCIRKSNAKLTIIHSTVSPGTTLNITKDLPTIGGCVVHSPVRGIHPHLYQSLKTFDKFVGADSYDAAQQAITHLTSIGIPALYVGISINSELGKILSTTYYGLCIAWHAEMEKMCKNYGADYNQAVTQFNETYNEGYKALGKHNVIRPVLYPPTGVNPHIGGHCIVPNAELLQTRVPSEALDLIVKYKKKE